MNAPVATRIRTVTRAEVEDFLYAEARILEAFDLERWLTLFEVGGQYQIPTTDAPPDADPAEVQFFVADDWDLLNARVIRLMSRNAHAENPRSGTHRVVSNVIVEPHADVDAVAVRAAFIVHRIRDGRVDPYLGHHEHVLAVTSDGLRFRRRRSVLAYEQLRPGGRLSFIL
ncbi:MAG TPA: aromatic-ring-hydroxylating dioxygenase subunit beta [Iamia sp.]|nr:aromatic-ring-hydroxylating dioxygenase subunit beta [Iamia sp.]